MSSNIRTVNVLGNNLSKLGFGAMRLPMVNGIVDQAQVNEMVEYALKNGVNYFDTSFVYCRGNSEAALGIALEPFDRSSYFLADKMTLWDADSVEYLETKFNESLKKLKTDYIDFYLMHSLNELKYEKAKAVGAVEWALEKKKEGKIRHLGFSIHDDINCLKRILDEYKWDFAQIQYNYLDTEGEPGEEGYNELLKRKIPVMVMEPLKGGILADISGDIGEPFRKLGGANIEYAFRWFMDKENIGVILSGMNSMEHIVNNIELFKGIEPLDSEEKAAVLQVCENIRASQRIGCTGCNYCIPCPMGIKISECFRAWNTKYMRKNSNWVSGISFDKDSIKLCTECGQCAEKCPQKINIPNKLKELFKEM